MRPVQKCCAQCPGLPATSSDDRTHDCCLPRHVAGNLRVSSLRRRLPGYPARERRESSASRMSCREKFAAARRLREENLQHRPLPDEVDDAVFRDFRRENAGEGEGRGRGDEGRGGGRRFGPELGCKKPSTRMDLAICWETPIDPTYEPRRPTHVDGSNGGAAPAIFALVRSVPRSAKIVRENSLEARRSDAESRRETEKRDIPASENGEEKSERSASRRSVAESQQANLKDRDPETDERRCRCERPCDGVESKTRRSVNDKTARKCAACEERRKLPRDSRPYDPRFVRSSLGSPIGRQGGATGDDEQHGRRRDGPAKVNVPRPRTPFAKRSFCIDSLAPPFSVVDGCRDADYPEHWRLMTVYQQSYKNPQKCNVRRHR